MFGFTMKNNHATLGFTLIEMAIVLAILGLLAGGVMAGQSLIKRSRVNTVIVDIGKYRTAFGKFQEIYQATPGDYVDATEQWGSNTASACTGSPTAADRTAKKITCNGNGDNIILPREHVFLWQHLANAGLVDGSFTGTLDSSNGITPGENAPTGPFESSGYYIDTSGPFGPAYGQPVSGTYYDQPLITELTFGRRVNASWPSAPSLAPTDQYSIDLKMDEGTPGNGKIRSLKTGANPGCATSDDASLAVYDRTRSAANCTLWIHIGTPII